MKSIEILFKFWQWFQPTSRPKSCFLWSSEPMNGCIQWSLPSAFATMSAPAMVHLHKKYTKITASQELVTMVGLRRRIAVCWSNTMKALNPSPMITNTNGFATIHAQKRQHEIKKQWCAEFRLGTLNELLQTIHNQSKKTNFSHTCQFDKNTTTIITTLNLIEIQLASKKNKFPTGQCTHAICSPRKNANHISRTHANSSKIQPQSLLWTW